MSKSDFEIYVENVALWLQAGRPEEDLRSLDRQWREISKEYRAIDAIKSLLERHRANKNRDS
jgi:hypothetical protein